MKSKHTNLHLGLVAGALLFAAPGFARPVQGAEKADTPQVAATRAKYSEPGWKQGGARLGIPLATLAIPGFKGEEIAWDGELLSRRFLDPKGEPAFVVTAQVFASAKATHALLLEWLSLVMNPKTMPRGEDLAMPAGDVSFVGVADAAPQYAAWIVFARDNVAVRISLVDPGRAPMPNLGAIARAVDQSIAGERPLAKDEALPRPTIGEFGAASTQVKAGETVALALSTRDVADGATSVRFELEGEATGYVEQDEHGAWVLHTTAPGQLAVTAHVLSSRGTAASKAIALSVTK